MAALGIRKLSAGLWVLPGAKATLQFTNNVGTDVNFGGETLKQGALQIAPWGKDNLQPQKMLELIYGNHIKPQLIYTARDFLLGARLGVYERIIDTVAGRKKIVLEPVIDPEMDEWLEQVEADQLLRASAYNLEFCHNYFASFVLDKRAKVEAIVNRDATITRALVTLRDRPDRYALHPDWRNAKAADVKVLPAYDKTNPTRFGDFIYHGRDWTAGQKYYDLAPWWGTRKWTELSNKIPDFHINGLENGYNIKYHIEIPEDYFDQFPTEEDKEEAEKLLVESMNSMLAGVENVDKAFVSKFGFDATGKARQGWKITPIDNKMSDQAYESVNQQANVAHAGGHGIDPSLAGVDTGSKLGGSGSEKRISYQLHIALRTPNKRKILLEMFNVAKKINGFNANYVFGFEDIEITTLAESSSGKKDGIPNPTK